MFCPYKYLFGVPGEGFHSYRFAGLAVGDTLGTVALAWVTSYLTGTGLLLNFIVWFVVGEVLHFYFGSQTAFLKLINLEPKC
jgi:hypothetical protein